MYPWCSEEVDMSLLDSRSMTEHLLAIEGKSEAIFFYQK
jgi:hypothetical protein